MDPRFKAILLSEDEVKLAIHLIKKEINEHIPDPQSQEEEVQESSEPSCSLWSSFDKLAKMNKPTENKQHIKDHISKYSYLIVPVLPRHEDPCLWCKDNAWQYHYLQCLAQHYLPIPTTQVASEGLFLSAGTTVTVRRANLNHEHVEQLVFLHHNMKNNSSF
jgi:hypothetical protein